MPKKPTTLEVFEFCGYLVIGLMSTLLITNATGTTNISWSHFVGFQVFAIACIFPAILLLNNKRKTKVSN